ncbi:hypothetical protein LOY85_18920 [Brevibacillus brevis]|uniref:hypothetical protein n=1 Tax=Brevibacillus brevis TaxID=1393 RepID=UPI001F3EA631|nr:hypothetical protein [Brevibacillus brevis]UIO40863.1 hypothetical protein LOY85_18920 [Brevibacillus brevis]
MKKISKIMVATALLSAFGVPSAMATEQKIDVKDVQQQKNLVKELVSEFNKHSDELIVTPDQPYKEIKLDNGYILFAELNPGQNTTVEASKSNSRTLAQASNEIESTHGYKNAYGKVLMQIRTTTKWTFDYSKVIEGSTSVVPEVTLPPWTIKSESVDLPFKGPDNRYWEWTAKGTFVYSVAGVEFDTITLITHHRANYDGTYAWKYEVID